MDHWLDIRRQVGRPLRPVVVLLACACGGGSIALPAPPPPPPPLASTPAGQAVLALAGFTPVLPGNVTVFDDTVPRPIRGATVSEIAKALGLDRGSDSDYVGATSPKVQWQFTQKRVGDTCAIVEVHVNLEIETHLPEWVRSGPVSATLVEQWREFLKATQQHENGHRNIALHTAIAIAQSLAGEHGLVCEELGELANASARAQWELGNRHQLTYDAATRHGETQGSRWPPFLTSPP